MRAFPTPPTAMLGSLYGARAKSKEQSRSQHAQLLQRTAPNSGRHLARVTE